ncbi:hypothetical protein [Malikia spinosa]|uniref:DNA methylase adenine-specific domain-containing protein n=1 Tax=Malikia spinosa TaxID=86180 RepID=A0A7C9N2L1_9BURK|nr:hypothetical protein [Malikia spinosa]MYZ52120.1 hypothetical protein [Malikia spinosa]
MLKTELPIPRAFRGLLSLASLPGARESEAITFALTWLAAARMVLTRQVPGATLDSLMTPAGWEAVAQAGLPLPLTQRWLLSTESTTSASLLLEGYQIVQTLVRELGAGAWDVLPTLTAAVMDPRDGGPGMVSAAVAELALEMLGAPAHRTLWIPFDQWGGLTIRALRRGWRVKVAPMMEHDDPVLPLMLAIELGQPQSDDVEEEIERDREGRPLTRADCVLACPPWGVPVRVTRLSQWGSDRTETVEQFARSETWVVNELLRRTTDTAVFLLSPGVLFTRGQEQLLRERLMHLGGEHNALHSVVTLPGGALSQTSLGSALVKVTPQRDNLGTLMVDLGLAKRAAVNLDELVGTHRLVALGCQIDPERACHVRREDILRNEVSLMPSRYLRASVSVGDNAVPLQDLCEALRAPTIAREDYAEEKLELGIPELGPWAPVAASGLSKVVRVRAPRGLPTLQPGDVVLSVKGTVGKSALVGEVEPDAVVVSQSCLGLRLRTNWQDRLTPEYLLMYLRSEAGQAQLEALQAGTTIQHVSPQTLLSSFFVPIPDAETRLLVEADYRHLCKLEAEIERLRQQMTRIGQSRWPR